MASSNSRAILHRVISEGKAPRLLNRQHYGPTIQTRRVNTPSRPSLSAAQVDFRTFIDQLRLDDDLVEIDREIDPHLEAAAIVRRVAEVKGKAPLFNNIKGAKPGGLFRIFGNAASLRSSPREKYGRIARNFGLKPTASWKDISGRIARGGDAPAQPPRVLSTGPW